ncbi:hypothetical protein GIB67_003666 [Kingdonia uniflora]|uniref:Amino acid transporter transmembrane domain-containing protein n=1 Tax=Kingdonia uniflora TaxID=39325 RepID=A0A7J7M426_9MAGN|nr:hypothetical protein GIB67_003666 [Kingdonia uniflora]
MERKEFNEERYIMKASPFSIEADEVDIIGVQIQEHGVLSSTTAHTTGLDPWQQVGLMLITSFNCAYILFYPSIIMVPLSWGWGVPSMFFFALFSAYSNWLLAGFNIVDDQMFIRYRDIMDFAFGRTMYYITWILQFINLFLANTGFILAAGIALKEINAEFSDSPLRLQYFLVISGVAYFIFAFLVPTMSAMKSWLGISAVLTLTYIIILVVILVKDGLSERDRDYDIKGSKADKVFHGLSAIAAIIPANSSGMLTEMQSTLRKPAKKNMRRALYLQFTLGLAVYYSITLVGYWAYGSLTSGYLASDLGGPKWAKVLFNSLVFLQTIVSQHMFLVPIHEAADTKFLKLNESLYSIDNIIRRFALRALLFAINTLLAAVFPFAGDFVNLVGSMSLIPLTFVFPSLIFIKVKGKSARTTQWIWHWAIIFFFSLLSIIATFSSIRSIIHNAKVYSIFADM